MLNLGNLQGCESIRLWELIRQRLQMFMLIHVQVDLDTKYEREFYWGRMH